MSLKSTLASVGLALAVVTGVSLASPALAQDAFGSGTGSADQSLGATGVRNNNSMNITGAQT